VEQQKLAWPITTRSEVQILLPAPADNGVHVRGLALSTLFLGVALIDPGPDVNARACMTLVRGIVFFIAIVIIWFGA